jgi:hypothetical protein
MKTHSDESVPRLKLQGILGVVDEGKARGAATAKVGAEAKDDDLVLGGLVHGRELVAEFVLGDVGAGGVEDIDDHLLALEQSVGDELAGADRYGSGAVCKS